MEQYTLLILISAAAIVVVAAVLVVRRSRERMEMSLQKAGFFALPQTDPVLKERIESVLSPQNRRISISRMYRYSGSNAEIYVVDPRSTTQNDETVVVTSSKLDLPRMLLFPKLPFQGRIVSFLLKLGESAISGGLPRVDMTGTPEFDRRYFLFAREAERVRAFFTDEIISTLVCHPLAFRVNAQGNLFECGAFRLEDAGKLKKVRRRDMTYWREKAAQAEDLCRILAAQKQPRAYALD